mgnify:CR=1 FL=1|jgi:hypothetical protein
MMFVPAGTYIMQKGHAVKQGGKLRTSHIGGNISDFGYPIRSKDPHKVLEAHEREEKGVP